MRQRTIIFIFLIYGFSICIPGAIFCQSEPETETVAKAETLTLVKAMVCEKLNGREPVNPAIVFAFSLGKIYCFTDFEPVPEKTLIYHNWFRRDNLSAKVPLSLSPPRWKTYSSIQLRERDRGPWRVEITDAEGNILQTLRFSVTD
ncbi:MAG: DUF2914 domain-containing protein [Desulfobacterales bacterium]|nr:MAG: DUF2914 domain-containing protein [Desulfobacterales bacterium]